MEQESSGLSIRRIVTGHNDAGKAVVAGDEQVPGTGLAEDSQSAAVFFHLWATHEMPVDLSDDAAATQREGSERTTLGSGSGSVLRIGVLPAGTRSPMHRTESLDYGICLEGECDMELDGGEVVSVHAERTTSGTTMARRPAASPGSCLMRSPSRLAIRRLARAGSAMLMPADDPTPH
jgi:hypothetical protein